MKLVRNPARLALYGALTLLLAWTIDNLVRSTLDHTVTAISSAKQALDYQEREAWLAGRLLDVQGSAVVVQHMLMTIGSRDRAVFSPSVLRMLGRQTLYERSYLDLDNLAKRAEAAKATLETSVSATGAASDIKTLTARIVELRNAGKLIQQDLQRTGQGLVIAAFAGQPYSADDDKVMLEQLQNYETRMAEIVLKSNEMGQRLETSIAAALAELQHRRNWLELLSATVRWLYLALFFVGTALTIASKGPEAKTNASASGEPVKR